MTDEEKEYAENYRWLRAQTWDKSDVFVVRGGKSAIKLGVDCPSHARLDAFIREARGADAEKDAALTDVEAEALYEQAEATVYSRGGYAHCPRWEAKLVRAILAANKEKP